ncbi:hypothetical protein G7Y89_g2547 [Cudoniella acicularis]|uniref:Uncharacterized protein n=1 Tax=Cudoniella acicularis TaxID=354080 RepID=A0A8H4W6V2_9HELO|nr:hypothetical protein G7Y89_g2547 [Cudoniella acicularis]
MTSSITISNTLYDAQTAQIELSTCRSVNLAKQTIPGAIPSTPRYELSHSCQSMNLVLTASPLEVLTERPVHAPMNEKDIMIRFDADEGGLSNKPRRTRRPWNLNSELTLSDDSPPHRTARRVMTFIADQYGRLPFFAPQDDFRVITLYPVDWPISAGGVALLFEASSKSVESAFRFVPFGHYEHALYDLGDSNGGGNRFLEHYARSLRGYKAKKDRKRRETGILADSDLIPSGTGTVTIDDLAAFIQFWDKSAIMKYSESEAPSPPYPEAAAELSKLIDSSIHRRGDNVEDKVIKAEPLSLPCRYINFAINTFIFPDLEYGLKPFFVAIGKQSQMIYLRIYLRVDRTRATVVKFTTIARVSFYSRSRISLTLVRRFRKSLYYERSALIDLE